MVVAVDEIGTVAHFHWAWIHASFHLSMVTGSTDDGWPLVETFAGALGRRARITDVGRSLVECLRLFRAARLGGFATEGKTWYRRGSFGRKLLLKLALLLLLIIVML